MAAARKMWATPHDNKRSQAARDKEDLLAAWLDDQRMAAALGQLSRSQLASLGALPGALDSTTPSPESVRVVKGLVKAFTGLDVLDSPGVTWAQMAAAARDHILDANRPLWNPVGSEGYFVSFANSNINGL